MTHSLVYVRPSQPQTCCTVVMQLLVFWAQVPVPLHVPDGNWQKELADSTLVVVLCDVQSVSDLQATGQAPVLFNDTPESFMTHSLLYVLPSQPHTGW